MAVLSDNNRAEVWAEFMRLGRSQLGTLNLTKADLRAAVDAIDSWVNTNAASLNSAIPQPARGAMTSAQKALLLVKVVEKRFLTGA